MKQSQKITIGVLVVVAAIGFLLMSGFSGNTGYQMSLTQIKAKGTSLSGQYLLAEGSLVKGTVRFDSKKIELSFVVTDGKTRIPVLYHGVAPDNLDYPEAQIILKGKYDALSGTFVASEVQTRCPSKYEAADQAPRGKTGNGR